MSRYRKYFKLIIIQLLIAVFVCLNTSNFIAGISYVNDYHDYLTTTNTIDCVAYATIGTDQLIASFDKSDKDYLLRRQLSQYVTGICFKGDQFQPEIIEGRNFNEDDFKNKSEVALVSEQFKDYIEVIDGKSYYRDFDTLFEVVGVYRQREGIIYEDSYIYLNMTSVDLNVYLTENSEGYYSFEIDSKLSTEETLSIIKSMRCKYSFIYASALDVIIDILSKQTLNVYFFIIIVLLLLFNEIFIIRQWLLTQRKECYVRYLAGADIGDIRFLFYRRFLKLSLFSFIGGLIIFLLSTWLYKWSIFEYFSYSLPSFISMFVIMSLLTLIGIINIYSCSKELSFVDGKVQL